MKIRRAAALFLCSLLVTMLLPLQAFAAGAPEADRAVSMKITYGYAGVPLTGAQFDVYLVAERNAAGELVITEDFQGYPVDWFGDTVSPSELANTLVGYVQADDLVPTHFGLINEWGTLEFNTAEHGLKQGRYLVIPNRFDTATHIYQSQPVLLDLPAQIDDNTWVYEVELRTKPQQKAKGDGGETITRKVLKVWDDEGYEHLRAVEVVIRLLRDGTEYDKVILNDKNNWRHTWDNLDSAYEWTVVEDPLELHTVKIEQMGITFVVTNSRKDPPVVIPTPTPTPVVTPTPTPVVTPKPTPTPPPTLPQTGQLWWPVPILFAGGLVLIVLGLLLGRRSGYEE